VQAHLCLENPDIHREFVRLLHLLVSIIGGRVASPPTCRVLTTRGSAASVTILFSSQVLIEYKHDA